MSRAPCESRLASQPGPVIQSGYAPYTWPNAPHVSAQYAWRRICSALALCSPSYDVSKRKFGRVGVLS